MRINYEFTDDDFSSPSRHQMVRAAAYFLLHAIGDINDAGNVTETAVVPVGTNTAPPAPPVAPAAMATATGASNAGASGAVNSSTSAPNVHTAPVHVSNVPPPPPPAPPAPPVVVPPPPPTNTAPTGDDDGGDDEGGPTTGTVVAFPTGVPVPPPPPANTAATSAAPSSVPTAAAAPGVVSAEVDSAGMPYDGRIHQKAKGKKKDGTWKLIKGIDDATVQAVTAELAAKRGSLPLPVPPVPAPTAAPVVPPPPAGTGAPVPVPPAPAVGALGGGNGEAYRALIDKITAATKEAKLTPAKVTEICQLHGAPNLGLLASMPHLVEAISKYIDAAVLGLV